MEWREGEVRELALDEFDQRFARYRLQGDRAARQAMLASLRRFGQLSPVVVCELGGRPVLIDGFKRHDAAGDVVGPAVADGDLAGARRAGPTGGVRRTDSQKALPAQRFDETILIIRLPITSASPPQNQPCS